CYHIPHAQRPTHPPPGGPYWPHCRPPSVWLLPTVSDPGCPSGPVQTPSPAPRAFYRSATAGAGGMASNVSTVSSLVYGSPRHFVSAISTARTAAGVPVLIVRRTARGKNPSSAAVPMG